MCVCVCVSVSVFLKKGEMVYWSMWHAMARGCHSACLNFSVLLKCFQSQPCVSHLIDNESHCLFGSIRACLSQGQQCHCCHSFANRIVHAAFLLMASANKWDDGNVSNVQPIWIEGVSHLGSRCPSPRPCGWQFLSLSLDERVLQLVVNNGNTLYLIINT